MKTKILTLIIILCSSFSFAQVELADKFFDNYGYVKAIELYERAVEKGKSNAHVLTRLGDAYYNNSNSEKAAYWYNKAFTEYNDIEAEYLYKYIQSLRSIGNYEEADVWFKKLRETQQGDGRLKGYDPDETDIYSKLTSKNEDLIVSIENLSFNSENADFGSYVFGNILYFASARGDDNKVYSWNKEPFLDIFQVEITTNEDQSQTYGTPEQLNAPAINTKYHDASIAITNDGSTMYFTRDNIKRKRLKYDKDGTTHLKLYKATRIDNEWSNVEELPFNDEFFSTGHPALSPDNSKLYFVSDRDGGIGQTDIYSVTINSDGTYGAPENLGSDINTEGREMFPFVSQDSTLYFSSDGHLNLGLLDIFKSNILKDEATIETVNIGAPFNSGYDDFAFFINSENDKGYFSSNRPGGKGSDDIYSYNIKECSQQISGTAREQRTDIILPDVSVKLIDDTGKVIEEVVTGIDGTYTFDVECDKTYTILGSKPDYQDEKESITTGSENEKVNQVDLYLRPLIKDDQIVINPIFFDFDKSNIRTDAQYELENIVDVLRKHPEMKIKIESHTDSRGRDNYNMKLSDRRAKSTRDYILSRDISPDRIVSAIGFGESQLLNKCSNGVKCSEEEHQLNRRSYFYIIDRDRDRTKD